MLLVPPNMLPWNDEWLLMYRLGARQGMYSRPNTAVSKQPASNHCGETAELASRGPHNHKRATFTTKIQENLVKLVHNKQRVCCEHKICLL